MEWEGHRPSAPSTPTGSVSSQSTGGTGSSREKVLPFKPLTPSPTVTTLAKFSDEELFHKGPEELLHILRQMETDYRNLLSEHSSLVKDINRRFQIFVLEARGLKEINQKLQDDNQELRDLCCFLDDDRQKSRKLAREWQRFGRYTASVMHSEVAAYQEKLKQLEEQQSELMADNLELKELCLFLDQERSQNRMTADRDDGDGSSGSTVPGHEEPTTKSSGDSDGQVTPTRSLELSSYVHQLEHKIQQLEEEKRQLVLKAEKNSAEGYHTSSQDGLFHPPRLDTDLDQLGYKTSQRGSSHDRKGSAFSVNKPEAVMHAMKVLQVHEQLERPPDLISTENLGETEKAIVREMCNVVWRKLGDAGEYPPHMGSNSNFSLPSPSQSAAGPDQPMRQQPAPAPHIPGGHTGPPPPARIPASLHSSHQTLVYKDRQDNMHYSPVVSSPGGPQSDAALMERRAQPAHLGRMQMGQQLPAGREPELSTQVGMGRGSAALLGKEKVMGMKGIRQQAPSYSQPVVPPAAHTAGRPKQMQPPPYSSSKNLPSPSTPNVPSITQFPPYQQIPQPHQQPPLSQSQPPPPRYQHRVHPLSATNNHPKQTQQQLHHPTQTQQQLPRSASASAAQHVDHVPAQPKSYSTSALQPHQHSGATYLYTQRNGPPVGGVQAQLKPSQKTDQPVSSSENVGRSERKQTYLSD